ncbi:Membrane-associated guanylate kinase, WW and PDZ domain-containing protein 3 [Clydaea vesicula]|uniref:Membrane-associated guanylate kinase, WW and PDZ domain-containing protein 3 n=1 Tax=Clydaea vesicula TaxID=447962 RepID=A0AAD5TV44_9FUNG|nr:Membrane-associated guanylate kinase, WW and PDZ domain-containing protein 3 [Clydaea vesicula]
MASKVFPDEAINHAHQLKRNDTKFSTSSKAASVYSGKLRKNSLYANSIVFGEDNKGRQQQIHKTPKKDSDSESIWTTADDKSIAHLEFEKTPSDDYKLPYGWSKQHEKWFFANAKTKTTTWIDPRDKFWKKKSWEECDPNKDEEPYGWEICHDAELGTYFIDHLNQRNTLDDPRINKFIMQVKELREFLKQEKDKLISEKTKDVQKVVNEKKILEQKVQRQNKGKVLPLIDENSEEMDKLTKQLVDVTASISRLKVELEDMISDFEDIENMTNRLEKENYDQLKSQKVVLSEINSLKLNYMKEVEVRSNLQKEIAQLKVVEVFDKDFKCPDVIKVESDTNFNSYINPEMEVDEKTPSNKITRLEREMYYLGLKKQFRSLKLRNVIAQQVATKARSEIEEAIKNFGANNLNQVNSGSDDSNPTLSKSWVTTINNYLAQDEQEGYTELESKARLGERLTFREKLFLLATSTHELFIGFQRGGN